MRRRVLWKWPRRVLVAAKDVQTGWVINDSGRWREVTDAYLERDDGRVRLQLEEYRVESFAPDCIVRAIPLRQVHQKTMAYRGARVTVDEYGESHVLSVRWRCIRGATKVEVFRQASRLYNTYCQHDYDCCGRIYYNVSSVRRVSGREWAITIKGSQNI